MPRLSVSLLGPFRASLDGQPLAGLESDKVRALLAFLIVESERPHRREELAGLLWPERPDDVARQDLSQALSNLRRATHDRTARPPFLDISRHEIGFNRASDHTLDAATFLALLGGCPAHLPRPQPYCPQCMAHAAQAVEMAYERLVQAQFALLDARGAGSPACYEAAYRFAKESVAGFHELANVDEGQAWAVLGYAAHCLGRHAEARQHLGEALRSARDARAPQVTAVVLAHLAAILADGEPERAVELYTLANRHPFMGNSCLRRDTLDLESRIAAAAARLPPEVVRAAQARGREGDWAAAAEHWIRELEMDRTGGEKGAGVTGEKKTS